MTPPRGPGITILVVDDDALITLNAVDVLNELGYSAIEAYSAHAALALIEARPDIAVLITDYAMPGMNGVELADEARRLRPGLPVLLATGYAELPDGVDGRYARLEKPYREDELADRLAQLLAVAAG